MAREIVLYPADVLKTPARPVDFMLDDLKYLKSVGFDLLERVQEHKGLGLAAPQIGESIRMFAMASGSGQEYTLMINPEYKPEGDKKIDGFEGCLSLPGPHNQVSRYKEIHVTYTSSEGMRMADTLEGLQARVFQHEWDHLEGLMFIDRMSKQMRKATLRAYEKGYHGRV